eukprot:scaffold25972_cov32-Tisochrysis_lutea.AAC.11
MPPREVNTTLLQPNRANHSAVMSPRPPVPPVITCKWPIFRVCLVSMRFNEFADSFPMRGALGWPFFRASSSSPSPCGWASMHFNVTLALWCASEPSQEVRLRKPRASPPVSTRAERESPRRSATWDTSHKLIARGTLAFAFIWLTMRSPAVSTRLILCKFVHPSYPAKRISADIAMRGSLIIPDRLTILFTCRKPTVDLSPTDSHRKPCGLCEADRCGAGTHETSYMWRRFRPVSRKPGSRVDISPPWIWTTSFRWPL